MSGLIRRSVAAMQGYVPGEQLHDPGLIKLNTNENPYPPAPGVYEVLRAFDPGRLARYPDPACRACREEVARLHGARPEQVIMGNGSDELLALCTRAFVEDDGSIGWFEPSYSLYPVLNDIADRRARPVELAEGFRWSMPEDYQASLFFLTQPNAPTSLAHDRKTIRDFCARFRGVVVIDEAYADFCAFSCMDLALEFDNVLVSRTFSKSYSLAALRLGYLVGPAPLIAALNTIKDSYNVDRLAQEIGLAALRDQAHMRANAAKIIATRERVAAALAARGFAVLPSQTNFLFAQPPGRPAQFVFEALRERRILIRFFSGPRVRDYLRITVGTDAEMDALLAALDDILK